MVIYNGYVDVYEDDVVGCGFVLYYIYCFGFIGGKCSDFEVERF